MNAETFMIWLGGELNALSQMTIEDGRKHQASLKLVKTAMTELDQMSPDERQQVLKALYSETKTRMIGNYQIPLDDGEQSDWVDAIVVTLQAHLE